MKISIWMILKKLYPFFIEHQRLNIFANNTVKIE